MNQRVLGVVREEVKKGSGEVWKVVLFGKVTHTGGKGLLTQQVHCEFMVSSETICPHFIQQVHAGYFLKVPTNSPQNVPAR